MGTKLSPQTYHPLLTDCWKALEPLDRPLGVHRWAGDTAGMWISTGGEELWRGKGVIACPLHCRASLKNVCWQNSDNNSGSCVMFCLAAVIIFIGRTSLLIKLCLLSRAVLLTFLFGLPVCGENSVSLLTCKGYIIVRVIFLFSMKIMLVFKETFTRKKEKKEKNEIPQDVYRAGSVIMTWDTFWRYSFAPFFFSFFCFCFCFFALFN